MPIGRRATDQGTGGTEWIPLPTGSYRFEIKGVSVRLSPFKNDRGEDQYQVNFALALTDEEYQRVKDEYGEIPEGTDLSGRVWYTCGLTLGWIDRAGAYQSTRLADFLVTLLGSKQQKQLREYIVAGGGPYLSEDATAEESMAEWETWFEWFHEAKVWGTVTHRQDKKIPGKIRADFGGPMAVGQRPGPADPDYEAWGRGKLRMLLLQGNESVPASDPDPEPVPATVANRLEESAPAAEMSAEDKARLAAQYKEIFGEAGVPA